MKEFIQYIPYEKKKQLKEHFYKEKIQEAKDKKVKPIVYNDKIFRFIFKWNELPEEVEKKILELKFAIDVEWIPKKLSEINFTIKSMEKWWFSQGFKLCPQLSRTNWCLVIGRIINGLELDSTVGVSDKLVRHYKKVIYGKDEEISLQNYIQYRLDDKEKKRLDRVEYEFSEGDIIYNPRSHSVKKITGMTRTQYRIEEFNEDVCGKYDFMNDKVESLTLSFTGTFDKVKNITKKLASERYSVVNPDDITKISIVK